MGKMRTERLIWSTRISLKKKRIMIICVCIDNMNITRTEKNHQAACRQVWVDMFFTQIFTKTADGQQQFREIRLTYQYTCWWVRPAIPCASGLPPRSEECMSSPSGNPAELRQLQHCHLHLHPEVNTKFNVHT